MKKKMKPHMPFFLSLTLIAVCSILVLSVAIFFWYRSLTIQNVNKANESVLLNTANVYRNYKDVAQNYTMDFYANPNIHALMMSGDTDWSDQLYSALSQIKGALIVNPYLENAYIFGTEEPVAMFENLPLSPDSKAELFRKIQDSRIVESPFLWTAQQNDGSDIPLITVFYNDRAFANSAYYGGVAITINPAELQKNLFVQQGEDSTHYRILDERGNLVMHSPGVIEMDPEMAQRIIQSEASTEHSFVFRGKEEAKLITYVHSEQDGLWFVSETSYTDSIRDISNARNLMMLLCLALTLAAIAIAFWISRRIYQPIDRIFGSIVHLSGSPDSQQSRDYRIVNRELETIGERMMQLRKENEDSAVLHWLLAPRDTDRNGTPQRLAELEGSYCVCALSVEQDCEELLRLIRLTFEEWANLRIFRPHLHTAVLIISELSPGDFEDVEAFRTRWNQVEHRAVGIRYALGISGLTDLAEQLKDRYDEACDCRRHVKFLQAKSMAFASDLLSLHAGPIPENRIEPIRIAVRKRDDASISQAVEQLLAVIGDYRAEASTAFLARLALELDRIGSKKTEQWDLGLLDLYPLIDRIDHHVELREWLEHQCRIASERLDRIDSLQTRSLAAEAVHYITEHYSDPDLSLNALAEKLSISSAYLSRLIADGTGSNFPELVNLHRLEQARRLLTDELELDIREIAEQVGYNSSTYFTTQFKKRYGVSPSKWRIHHVLEHHES